MTSRAVAAFNRLGKTRHGYPFLALAAFLSIAFAVRYYIVAQHLDMGGDIANYLSTMNTLFGDDVTGVGLNRPPLIGFVLKPFTLVFGDLAGVKMLGALVSVLMGIPFYLLMRRISHPWIAVAMTIVFVLTPAYSDMLSWGYLTMFGISFIMLALHFLLRVLEEPSRVNIFFTGLSASFVVGFHQLSLAFFAPLFALLLAALLVFNRQNVLNKCRPLTACIAATVVLSLPYIPVYLRLLSMQAPAVSHVPLISLTPLSQVAAALSIQSNLVYMPLLAAIVLLLTITAFAMRPMWRTQRSTAVVLSVTLLYSLVLVLFIFPPPFQEINRRAHHFMYIPVWILCGFSLSGLWSWRGKIAQRAFQRLPQMLTIAVIVALLASSVFLSVRGLVRGVAFYEYLDETRWSAVKWIKDNTPEEAYLVAHPQTLGWWIEAGAHRRTANVADRDTVPYSYLRDRSLAADRILSRNQGFENGNLRLATTYPYDGAPGQPVLGVYADGSYRDIMMFDDSSISLSMASGETANLADDAQREFSISGDGDSMVMTTQYLIDGAEVDQRASLERGSQTIVISYHVQTDGVPVTRFDVPVLFGFEPESVSIAPDLSSVEVIQLLRRETDRVVTRISISVDGAAIQEATMGDDGLRLSFSVQSDEAAITFNFDVADPELDSNADVIRYYVSEIIKNPGLEHLPSIDYLAVDLRPNPNLASAIPWGTEEWLNACPYYELLYSEGDIRIYEVGTSALP